MSECTCTEWHEGGCPEVPSTPKLTAEEESQLAINTRIRAEGCRRALDEAEEIAKAECDYEGREAWPYAQGYRCAARKIRDRIRSLAKEKADG